MTTPQKHASNESLLQLARNSGRRSAASGSVAVDGQAQTQQFQQGGAKVLHRPAAQLAGRGGPYEQHPGSVQGSEYVNDGVANGSLRAAMGPSIVHHARKDGARSASKENLNRTPPAPALSVQRPATDLRNYASSPTRIVGSGGRQNGLEPQQPMPLGGSLRPSPARSKASSAHSSPQHKYMNFAQHQRLASQDPANQMLHTQPVHTMPLNQNQHVYANNGEMPVQTIVPDNAGKHTKRSPRDPDVYFLFRLKRPRDQSESDPHVALKPATIKVDGGDQSIQTPTMRLESRQVEPPAPPLVEPVDLSNSAKTQRSKTVKPAAKQKPDEPPAPLVEPVDLSNSAKTQRSKTVKPAAKQKPDEPPEPPLVEPVDLSNSAKTQRSKTVKPAAKPKELESCACWAAGPLQVDASFQADQLYGPAGPGAWQSVPYIPLPTLSKASPTQHASPLGSGPYGITNGHPLKSALKKLGPAGGMTPTAAKNILPPHLQARLGPQTDDVSVLVLPPGARPEDHPMDDTGTDSEPFTGALPKMRTSGINKWDLVDEETQVKPEMSSVYAQDVPSSDMVEVRSGVSYGPANETWPARRDACSQTGTPAAAKVKLFRQHVTGQRPTPDGQRPSSVIGEELLLDKKPVKSVRRSASLRSDASSYEYIKRVMSPRRLLAVRPEFRIGPPLVSRPDVQHWPPFEGKPNSDEKHPSQTPSVLLLRQRPPVAPSTCDRSTQAWVGTITAHSQTQETQTDDEWPALPGEAIRTEVRGVPASSGTWKDSALYSDTTRVSTGLAGLGTSDPYFLSSTSSQTRYSPGATDYLIGLGSPLPATKAATSSASYASTTGYADSFLTTSTYGYSTGATEWRSGLGDLDSVFIKRTGSESKLGTGISDSYLLTTADSSHLTSTSETRYQTSGGSDLRLGTRASDYTSNFGVDDSLLLKRTYSETSLVNSSSESRVTTLGDVTGSVRAFGLDSIDLPALKGASSDSWLLTPASETAAEYRGSSSYESKTTRISRSTSSASEASKFVSDAPVTSRLLLSDGVGTSSLATDGFDFSRYLSSGIESSHTEKSAKTSTEWSSALVGSSSTTFQSSSSSKSSFTTARTYGYTI